MKTTKKWSKVFLAGVAAMALSFGLILMGCASLNNLFNPIHAINTSGEKLEAALGSGQTVKIDGTEYQYKARPMVPAAPQKPNEPRKPSPPRWTSGSLDITTGDYHTVESFSSRAEAIKKIEYYTAQGQRTDISHAQGAHYLYIAAALSDSFDFYEGQQKQYESALAQYQANLPKYQQDIAKYEQDLAAYQAKLPEYTAAVEAEAMAIQANIYPDAPSNWDRYVEGQFLLYKGK